MKTSLVNYLAILAVLIVVVELYDVGLRITGMAPATGPSTIVYYEHDDYLFNTTEPSGPYQSNTFDFPSGETKAWTFTKDVAENGTMIIGTVDFYGRFSASQEGQVYINWQLVDYDPDDGETEICRTPTGMDGVLVNTDPTTLNASCTINTYFVPQGHYMRVNIYGYNANTTMQPVTHYWNSPDSGYVLQQQSIGILGVELIGPTNPNISMGDTFVMNCSLNCTGGDCIDVYVFAEYDDGSGWKNISNNGTLILNQQENPQPIGNFTETESAFFVIKGNVVSNNTIRCVANSSSSGIAISQEKNITILPNPPPSAPTDLIAQQVYDGILLNWTAPSEPDVDHYRVYRSTVFYDDFTMFDTNKWEIHPQSDLSVEVKDGEMRINGSGVVGIVLGKVNDNFQFIDPKKDFQIKYKVRILADNATSAVGTGFENAPEPIFLLTKTEGRTENVKMTSNTEPEPYSVNASSNVENAWHVFDWESSSWETFGDPIGQWVSYDFGENNSKEINKVKIYLGSQTTLKGFKIQGKNETWVDLFEGEAPNSSGWHSFSFDNNVSYRYYRILILSVWGGEYVQIPEMQLVNDNIQTRYLYGGMEPIAGYNNETIIGELTYTAATKNWNKRMKLEGDTEWKLDQNMTWEGNQSQGLILASMSFTDNGGFPGPSRNHDTRYDEVNVTYYSPIADNINQTNYRDVGCISGKMTYYVVTAVDTAGNEGPPSNEASAICNAPPGTITNLSETSVGTTWIYWEWVNPTDSDFDHVEIWLDGTWVENISFVTRPSPPPAYNATGLSPGTMHTLSVRTVDSAGNVNTTWVNDSATTLSVPTPSRPSGGAGGAPSPPPPPASVVTEYQLARIIINNIPANVWQRFDIRGANLSLVGISLITRENVSNASIAVVRINQTGCPEGPGGLLSYDNLNITTRGLEGKVKEVIFAFKINRSWLENNPAINISSLALSRCVNGSWQMLLSYKYSEDENYFYYSSISPEFSEYGITFSLQCLCQRGEWGPCVNGTQSMIDQDCGPHTNYTCIPFVRTQACAVPGVPGVPDFVKPPAKPVEIPSASIVIIPIIGLVVGGYVWWQMKRSRPKS